VKRSQTTKDAAAERGEDVHYDVPRPDELCYDVPPNNSDVVKKAGHPP